MQQLWAPWRMQFIHDARDGKIPSCALCELQQMSDDREALVLLRGKLCYIVLNKYPYISGHLMVVPKRHVAELHDLTNEESAELLQLTGLSVRLLRQCLDAEGVNCGINLGKVAGAGIRDHVHMHIVPRWAGDTNFLPVMSDVRVLPEYLHATYDRLAKAFRHEGEKQ